jgi:hypothetical protein
MPIRRIRSWEAALRLALVAIALPASAQNLPPTPRTPDLMGIYTGMPAQAARAQLQKRSSTVNVTSASPPDSGFGLTFGDPANPDGVYVYLTRAPNEPAVWMVTRSQAHRSSEGPPLMLNTVLAALREKYGKETFTRDQGGGGLYVYWLFDQAGKLLATADQTLQGCNSGQFDLYMRNGLPQAPTQVDQACFKYYFGVKASFNLGANGMLNSYVVELVNLPYAYRAAMNTDNVKKAADQKAQQDLIKQGNQNKPTF